MRFAGLGDEVPPVSPLDAEFAKPAWVFGMSSYAIIDAQTILATYGTKGTYQLALIDTTTGQITDIETPYTDFNYIRANAHRATFLAGSPTQRNALLQLDLTALNSHSSQ